MSAPLGTVAGLVAFPVVATVVGAAVAAVRPPGPRLTSAVRHFTAGVVFSAAAGEVLPELRSGGRLPAVLIGFGLGVAVLIGLQRMERRSETKPAAAGEPAALPVGMLLAVGIDLFIDGVLVGVAVTVGEAQGRLLTIALTLEVLFLGLATATELAEGGASRRTAALVPAALALTVPVGALGAALVLGSAPPWLLAGVLAFGIAALLFLVTEELLVEAHETTETGWLTAMFFVGFIAIYVLEGSTG